MAHCALHASSNSCCDPAAGDESLDSNMFSLRKGPTVGLSKRIHGFRKAEPSTYILATIPAARACSEATRFTITSAWSDYIVQEH